MREAFKLALKLHEDSYDHLAAHKAQNSGEFLNFVVFYSSTENDCIRKACKEHGLSKEYIYVIELMFMWKNDSADWSDKVLCSL